MAFEALAGLLSRDEAVVLVTLARALVRADGQITDPELDAILDLARAVGLDVFADAVDGAEMIRLTDAQLRQLAERIGEAHRVLVLEALLDLGASDGLVDPERDLLVALSRHWAVEEPTLR